MNEQMREHLAALLQYVWDDEKRNFEACYPDDEPLDRTKHIFHHIDALQTWLEATCVTDANKS